jgi:hypothetical protein
VRGLFQSPKALLGVALPPGFGILPSFGPQSLVSGSHLPEDTARHLGWQRMLRADRSVEVMLQPPAATGLAVGKSIPAHLIQGVAVSQLGGP